MLQECISLPLEFLLHPSIFPYPFIQFSFLSSAPAQRFNSCSIINPSLSSCRTLWSKAGTRPGRAGAAPAFTARPSTTRSTTTWSTLGLAFWGGFVDQVVWKDLNFAPGQEKVSPPLAAGIFGSFYNCGFSEHFLSCFGFRSGVKAIRELVMLPIEIHTLSWHDMIGLKAILVFEAPHLLFPSFTHSPLLPFFLTHSPTDFLVVASVSILDRLVRIALK